MKERKERNMLMETVKKFPIDEVSEIQIKSRLSQVNVTAGSEKEAKNAIACSGASPKILVFVYPGQIALTVIPYWA